MTEKAEPAEDLFLGGDDLAGAKPVATKTPRRRHGKHLGAPYSWLKLAYAASRGKGDAYVALHLYHWHIIRKSRTVIVSNAELEEFGITRYEKYRSLERFEQAGLIRVVHGNGKAPKVTLLVVE